MDRRSFLKSSGLLVGGLYLSGKAFANILAKDQGKPITGTVKHRGKGIANAVISNGYEVVLTDKKGRYHLPANAQAQHVFLSTPAGYQIKSVAGFATFYISTVQGDYSFELEKTPYDDINHSFLALGDPQIREAEDIRQFYIESIPDIQAFLASTDKNRFHGCSLGDSIWDTPKMWAAYKDGIAKIGIPFFQVIGNHDKQEATDTESDNARLFKKQFGPTYYSFNRGKVHYVVLDDIRYKTIKEYDGHISIEQLAWLKKDLSHVPKNHLIVISLHIPVHTSVKNKEDLYALLTTYEQVHILSGHTHTNFNHVMNNIYEHTVATLCGAWWTGSICADGTPRGYGVFEVKDTTISWFYKPIGQPFDYQFHTAIQKLNHGINRITVNVWNYDPQWKVTWYADGTFMGDLEQIKGFDERAVSMYKGEKLPADRRGWVEPKRTNHLFYAQSEAKSIRIVVHDRFGHQYEETLNLK